MELSLRNGGCALIDDCDYETVKNYVWRRNALGYVLSQFKRNGKMNYLYLHRFLLPEAEIVDHINGNKLDNRRHNIRAANKSINSLNRYIDTNNSSGRRGVYFDTTREKWVARIKVGSLNVNKRFSSFSEAVACREKLEKLYLGHTLTNRQLNKEP